MNANSSERLVVFVTPAQKRVLAARAQRMGISLSELVRRAVLAFDDTGPEVRAAGLIDRLGAASEASLRDPLRQLAQAGPREGRRGVVLAGAPCAAPAEAAQGALADDQAAGARGPANPDGPAGLPVAAAVARLLMADEAAEVEDTPDPETLALVGRLLDSGSPSSV